MDNRTNELEYNKLNGCSISHSFAVHHLFCFLIGARQKICRSESYDTRTRQVNTDFPEDRMALLLPVSLFVLDSCLILIRPCVRYGRTDDIGE